MIVEIPDDNSIVKWKMNDKDEWKSAEIPDLIKAHNARPRGVWISRSYYRPSTKQYDCEMTICSECKEEYSYDSETGIDMINYSFCPNCGADMQGR